MKRKTSQIPSRVYSYGSLPPSVGLDLFESELRGARGLFNDLVQIERCRREAVEAAQRAASTVEHIADALVFLEDFSEAAEAALKSAKAGAGKRADVRGEALVLRQVKLDRAEARDVLKAAKAVERARYAVPKLALEVAAKALVDAKSARLQAIKAARGAGASLDPLTRVAVVRAMEDRDVARAALEAVDPLATINARATVLKKAAYNLHEPDCFWSTRLKVLESAEQAFKKPALGQPGYPGWPLPKFKRVSEEGSVAVQLQGGLSVRELLSCEDTRLRMAPAERRVYSEEERRRGKIEATSAKTLGRRWRVWLRVGSKGTRGAEPVWVSAQIVLHRPLPEDGVISWAKLLRRKVGDRHEYRVQFTLEASSFLPSEKDLAPDGVVAIDLGWRNLPEEMGSGVRVAYLLDQLGVHGGIEVSTKTTRGLEKVDDLRSIRDKLLDKAKAKISAFRAIGFPDANLTRWFLAETRYAHGWRSPGKLHRLIERWSSRRDGILGLDVRREERDLAWFQAWCRKDRHLHAWEDHQRDRRIGHRQAVWRAFAADLSRRYRTVILEDPKAFRLNKPEFAALPEPEDGVPSDGREQRRTARVAAPGQFRDCITAAFRKRGGTVRFVDPAMSTRRCNLCGFCEPWDAKASVLHVCGGCRVEWDQDENAARNLMRDGTTPASGAVVSADAGSLATDSSTVGEDEDVEMEADVEADEGTARDGIGKAA